MLTGSSKVAIPINRKTIKMDDSAVFGLGVRNILKANKNFQITVAPSKKVFQGTETPITLASLENDDWQLLYDPSSILIKNNELKKFPISIKVGKAAQGATYIFTVEVKYDGGSYSTPEKIYVKIA